MVEVSQGLAEVVERLGARLTHVMGLQDADAETLAEAVESLHAIAERVENLARRVEALERAAGVVDEA